MNSLILNQYLSTAAIPDHNAPPTIANMSKVGIIKTWGRFKYNPPTVANRAPISSCPGCPRFIAPEANATEADNPVKTKGTELLSVYVIFPGESEYWNRRKYVSSGLYPWNSITSAPSKNARSTPITLTRILRLIGCSFQHQVPHFSHIGLLCDQLRYDLAPVHHDQPVAQPE